MIAKTCEGVMSIDECERALKTMENNKSSGTDGLTPEFYRYFWNLLGSFTVGSLNFAFRNGLLSSSLFFEMDFCLLSSLRNGLLSFSLLKELIPKSLQARVGDMELFKCNYDYNLLDLENHLPAF